MHHKRNLTLSGDNTQDGQDVHYSYTENQDPVHIRDMLIN